MEYTSWLVIQAMAEDQTGTQSQRLKGVEEMEHNLKRG